MLIMPLLLLDDRTFIRRIFSTSTISSGCIMVENPFLNVNIIFYYEAHFIMCHISNLTR
jgi:hypothetical protein